MTDPVSGATDAASVATNTATGTVTAVQIDTTTNSSTAVIGGKSVDVGRITQVGHAA